MPGYRNHHICRGCVRALLFILALFSACISAQDAPEQGNKQKHFRIGLRAINGIKAATYKWQATVDYLNQHLPEYHFDLVPIVDFNEMRDAVSRADIDFVLTNPSAYADIHKQYDVTSILTLNNLQPGGSSTTFASVIFTRSNRSDINSLEDIRGHTIMGVHSEAFGGWQTAEREYYDAGLDPYDESRQVLFSPDGTQRGVVLSVISNRADIGVVRTGIIEGMIENGILKAEQIKVIHPIKDDLALLHSTRLYPEWPFAVLPHVPNEVSNAVFRTLLKITPESMPAVKGSYYNWASPMDYSDVQNLMDEIKRKRIGFTTIWIAHSNTIILILVFILAMIFYTLYLAAINRKLLRSEQALTEHRNQLEDKVKSRTANLSQEIEEHKKTELALNIAREDAENANMAKSLFLSQMSHEFRTPLNAILGFGQLLKMDLTDDPDTSENIDEILNAGRHLLALTNEILDLAKIESGNVSFHSTKLDCCEVLKECISLVNVIAEKHNIIFNKNIDSCCIIEADEKRLKQVFINLLSNAVKYSEENSQIDIDFDYPNDQTCRITIHDYGMGIKAEDMPQIFQPFFRASDQKHTTEGTGIGLVITKQLVEHMGGEINFSSEYGKGSQFWVSMPVSRN